MASFERVGKEKEKESGNKLVINVTVLETWEVKSSCRTIYLNHWNCISEDGPRYLLLAPQQVLIIPSWPRFHTAVPGPSVLSGASPPTTSPAYEIATYLSLT